MNGVNLTEMVMEEIQSVLSNPNNQETKKGTGTGKGKKSNKPAAKCDIHFVPDLVEKLMAAIEPVIVNTIIDSISHVITVFEEIQEKKFNDIKKELNLLRFQNDKMEHEK